MKFEVITERIDLADELEDEFRPNAKAGVLEAGKMYLASLKELLARQPSGDPAPPERPPAKQTEELIRSLGRRGARISRDKLSVSLDITSTLPYEHFNSVEYGHINANGTRTLPRPFKRPTDVAMEPKINALFRERF